MPERRGPIPRKDADFSTYINQAIPYLNTEKARLGVSMPNINLLNSKRNAWNLLYPKTQDKTQRTSTLTNDKNILRDEIEDLLRIVYDDIPESVLNSTDRDKLNLQERDTVPTASELSDNPPDIDLKETGVSYQKIHARNIDDPDSDGIPEEVRHIKAAWHIGDDPPANPNDFGHTKAFTRAIFKIEFKPEDSGKMAHIALQYIGHRGQEGPWSKVVSVGIA